MEYYSVSVCQIVLSFLSLLPLTIKSYQLEKLPFGVTDFAEMIKEGRLFVDRSLFIKDVITLRPKVLLMTRPHGTGKSIILSMMRTFLDDKHDSKELFKNTMIANYTKFCDDYQNKHPVIYISFGGFHGGSFYEVTKFIREKLKNVYKTHMPLNCSQKCHEQFLDVDAISSVCYSEKFCKAALRMLIKLVREASGGKKVYLLIDNYDALFLGTRKYGDVREFFAEMFANCFKDNNDLATAVFTGIAPFVDGDIFSNVRSSLLVDSVIKPLFPHANGFTTKEVEWLVKERGKIVSMEKLRAMYGGYMVGGSEVYNPCSVVHSLALGRIEPFWAEMVPKDVLNSLLDDAGPLEKMNFEKLLSNHTIQKPIYNNLVYKDLNKEELSFWTALVHAGYLTAVFSHTAVHYFIPTNNYNLSIPNADTYTALTHAPNTICSVTECDTSVFYDSLENGRMEAFYKVVSKFFENSGSFHRWDKYKTEKDYQIFLGEMISMLNEKDYEVLYNYKSGPGYFDLAVFPTDTQKPGIIFGFKKASDCYDDHNDHQKAAAIALAQVLKQSYLTPFFDRKIKSALVVGMGFYRKNIAMNFTLVTDTENIDKSTHNFTFLYW